MIGCKGSKSKGQEWWVRTEDSILTVTHQHYHHLRSSSVKNFHVHSNVQKLNTQNICNNVMSCGKFQDVVNLHKKLIMIIFCVKIFQCEMSSNYDVSLIIDPQTPNWPTSSWIRRELRCQWPGKVQYSTRAAHRSGDYPNCWQLISHSLVF